MCKVAITLPSLRSISKFSVVGQFWYIELLMANNRENGVISLVYNSAGRGKMRSIAFCNIHTVLEN